MKSATYAVMAAAVIAVSGCGTTGLKMPNSRSGGLAGAAKTIKPEYASAIDKVVEILVGKQPEFVNPIEGFKADTIWYVDGKVVPASVINKEVRYSRIFSADDSNVTPLSPAAQTSALDAMDPARRDELRKKVEAVFNSIPLE